MTQSEKDKMQELAEQAMSLARLRDQRRISEFEYIEWLNVLRQKQGLLPIPPPGQEL